MAKPMVRGYGEKTGTWTRRTYDLSGKGQETTPVRVRRKRLGDGGGILWQFPPGWDDGSGKVKHLPKGHPQEGRVYFSNRAEAMEIAKRYEGMSGDRTRFDPM